MLHDPNYNSPPGIELKLKWTATWPDREHDFTARTDTGEIVGRFYWRDHDMEEYAKWVWFQGEAKGTADTSREAAKAVEDSWFSRKPDY